jgi:hypothetical protein
LNACERSDEQSTELVSSDYTRRYEEW